MWEGAEVDTCCEVDLTESERRIKSHIEEGRFLQALEPAASQHEESEAAADANCVSLRLQASWVIRGQDLEEVGEIEGGSFGKVILCRLNSEKHQQQTVVVKRIPDELACSPKNRDGFIRECLLLRSLRSKGRSNIVEFVGISVVESAKAGRWPGVQLVQEFCTHGCLGQLLLKQMRTTGGRPTLQPSLYTQIQALGWIVQVAEALKDMHSATPPIIHRDVKPDNIFLTDCGDGQVVAKLGDFGAAKRIRRLKASDSFGNENTRKSFDQPPPEQLYELPSRGFRGARAYMAPELLMGSAYNDKVDMFSLGVSLYEMLHGCIMVVLVSESEHTIEEDVDAYLRRVVGGYRIACQPELSPELQQIIAKMWAHNPDDRPNADEAISMLEAALLNLRQSAERVDSASQARHQGDDHLAEQNAQAGCCSKCAIM
eukprot:jgi/Tetstr1/425630/TSEL_016050.t1